MTKSGGSGAAKPRTRTEGQQARVRYRKASKTGGSKARRLGGSMDRSRGLPGCYPRELEQAAEGCMFSPTRATPAQVSALREFLVAHVRDVTIGQHSGMSAETLAEATGLTAPTVRKRLARGLAATLDAAEVLLTAEVLVRMRAGTFAGPLGYAPSQDTEELFKRMEFPPGEDFNTQVDRLNLCRRYGVDLKALYAAFKLDRLAHRNHRNHRGR